MKLSEKFVRLLRIEIDTVCKYYFVLVIEKIN